MRICTRLLLFCFVSTTPIYTILQDSALTFIPNSGRFGDNITNYIKAKWLAYKYDIQFYFVPFEHSDLLQAHIRERRLDRSIEAKFRKNIILVSEHEIVRILEPTLFRTNGKTSLILKNGKEANAFRDFSSDMYDTIKRDNYFFKEIRTMLLPAGLVKVLKLPKDKITVAVHVRKGSASDTPLYSQQLFVVPKVIKKTRTGNNFADKLAPKKFPPEQYYIDQIKYIYELFGHKMLFVYLFTDHKNPEVLVEGFTKAINSANIEITTSSDGSYTTRIIDDIYNMAQFDCLIRPDSAFSFCSQLLGQHKIIIYPETTRWEGDVLFVNAARILAQQDDN